MNPPVIFFSFEGVLNSRRWLSANPCDGSYCAGARVDPAAVAQLNRIVDATGAELVRVEHWKIRCNHDDEWSPPRFQAVLKRRGFTGRVRGYTGAGATRADEIESWLRLQGADQPRSFCIINADAPMPGLGRFVVWTSPIDGLTAERADRAIAILGVST